MTNDIFCVGLTRMELQTLGVLLAITKVNPFVKMKKGTGSFFVF